MHIRAVVFDFYGTLTCAVQRGAAHAAIARLLGCDPDVFGRVLNQTYYLRVAGRLGCPLEALRILAYIAHGHPAAAALHGAFAERIAAVRSELRLREDAVAVLKELRAGGIRTAVISNCWYELPVVFPQFPVAPLLLDATVFSYEVGHSKPHPELYRKACRRLAVRPADCMYVGDGDSRELTGATRVGMTAVRLAAPDLAGHLTFQPELGWSGPEVTSLTDVLALVAEPNRKPALALV